MKFLNGAVALLSGLLARSALAAPPATPMQRDVELEMRNEIEPRVAPTCNTPSNRACWTTGFDINTDYETSTPPSGTTRQYTLNITEVDNWVGPDGAVKPKAMLVNGRLSGA